MPYTRGQRIVIEGNIERDVMERWGWDIRVRVSPNGSVSWNGNRSKNQDRYDMYPDMTQEQADEAVMAEILSIIRQYIPGFQYTSFEQSGQMHYV